MDPTTKGTLRDQGICLWVAKRKHAPDTTSKLQASESIGKTR
ncbi:hypothetical protein RE6C_04250 [Rhodopirellula europaea 6C]|uniref:Uncharacterized protein n=1 Tax=Rhodopirellula europaea 6C TaxID=1263867 RepID=M2AQN7_9BACT|nr:hypothetical protein RE6C_04250 [Rhodopirellula europaea 6C]